MKNRTLAGQQEALLDALWRPHHEDAFEASSTSGVLEPAASCRRGVMAYRANGHALAERALRATYPVVAQLLGTGNFEPLARGLWLHQPPERGDMAQWGGTLPGYIDSTPDLRRAEPYLSDVARVEWQLHCAASAADGSPDISSLQILAQRDASQVTLLIAAGTACVPSAYPVVSIVNAHAEGVASLARAGERLRGAVAEVALVWRKGLKPTVREALPGEAGFLAALQAAQSLGDSLDCAGELDFHAWLTAAAQDGLLLGARVL